MIVAMVYKTGGDYDASYVRRLAHGVRKHVTAHDLRILCLTDRPSDVNGHVDEVVLLKHDWPAWWAKMELFALQGPLLYLDLDTVIVGNLDELVQWIENEQSDKTILMLRGFYRNDVCSGVMGWTGKVSSIYVFFEKLAARGQFRQRTAAMNLVVTGRAYRGDQELLRVALPPHSLSSTFVQTVIKGVYSYKVDLAGRGDLPEDAKLVCFHGKPRPGEIDPSPGWLCQHWEKW